MSLRDALKDIGSKFVEQLDEYIDELLTLNNWFDLIHYYFCGSNIAAVYVVV